MALVLLVLALSTDGAGAKAHQVLAWGATSTGSMTTPRQDHVATLLPDGHVLVAGGSDSSGNILYSAELYDPTAGTWRAIDGSIPGRANSATLLPSGKVLVTVVTGPGNTDAELYDPHSGVWTATGSLTSERDSFPVVLLQTGKVLAAGGCCGPGALLSSAEVYDPGTGLWTATGSMIHARRFHMATLLASGKILVVGGTDYSGASLSSAEIYDPDTGAWTATSNMTTGRTGATATLLSNGDVLVAGGCSDSNHCSQTTHASAEVYDPHSGTWTATGSLNTARTNQTATVLPTGQVLVVGGVGRCDESPCAPLNSAEVYDPATGRWTAVGNMNTARVGQTATLLKNGTVLITGGWQGPGAGVLASAELYTPSSSAAITLSATTVDFGTQLVTTLSAAHAITFTNESADVVTLDSASLRGTDRANFTEEDTCTRASIPPAGYCIIRVHFSPASGGLHATVLNLSGMTAARQPFFQQVALNGEGLPTSDGGVWSSTGSMHDRRMKPAATLLRNGKVLVIGGYDQRAGRILATAELYDPHSGRWTRTGSMTRPHGDPLSTLLPSGKVLAISGTGDNDAATAELYDPSSGRWTATGSLPISPSGSATALTLLHAGHALVIVGSDAEVYDPATATWSTTGSLRTGRSGYSATVLRNGRVLVAGGITITCPGESKGCPPTTSTETYDPATGVWLLSSSMVHAREGQVAVLLTDGRVLVIGGAFRFNRPDTAPGASAEVYDPHTGRWTATRPISMGNVGAATLLPTGQVLALGIQPQRGGLRAELYEPRTGIWTDTGSLSRTRELYATALLATGQVLVAGGNDALLDARSAVLFTATTLTVAPTTNTGVQRGKVTGTGFAGDETVKIYLDRFSDSPLAITQTTHRGSFATYYQLPSMAGGMHRFMAVGFSSGRSASTRLQLRGH